MPTDDYYRLPAIMQDCKTAYSLTWQDGGTWSGYTFVRKATMPNINGIITFRATISIARKPKYFLGIKIHRAIIQISWELTSAYTDTHVTDVLTLDPNLPNEEKTKIVNNRISEIAREYPNCKSLPSMPVQNLWKKYRTATCTTCFGQVTASKSHEKWIHVSRNIRRPRILGEDDALQAEHHRRTEGCATGTRYGRGS